MDAHLLPLEGKAVLVTGGSRGIGRASALLFAKAGADVVVASRKLEGLEKVAEEIRTMGRKGLAIASHVGKLDESKKLVDQVMKKFGRIDVLMNNAGTNPYAGEMIDAEEWAWDVTMNVNLKGPFFLSQAVAKIMREKGGGSIIFVASTAGMRPSELGIYNVTKAGVIMLAQTLAKEWGQYNIKVNAIAPGLIKTQMTAPQWQDQAVEKEATKYVPLGRLGEPEDVAQVALFLASDASRHISGDVIPVDGAQILIASSTPLPVR